MWRASICVAAVVLGPVGAWGLEGPPTDPPPGDDSGDSAGDEEVDDEETEDEEIDDILDGIDDPMPTGEDTLDFSNDQAQGGGEAGADGAPSSKDDEGGLLFIGDEPLFQDDPLIIGNDPVFDEDPFAPAPPSSTHRESIPNGDGGAEESAPLATVPIEEGERVPVSVLEPDADRPPAGTDRWGLALLAGAGVQGFVDTDSATFAQPGLAYGATLVAGTHRYLAVEVSYAGSLQNIDGPGLDRSSLLVSNALEAAGRIHFSLDRLQPYFSMGLGWRHYGLAGASFNTSSVARSDDVLEVPLGLGLAWRSGHAVFDGRFLYRIATGEDLFVDTRGPKLDCWSLGVRGGYEF